VALGIAAARLRDLFAVVMLFGIYSLVSAALFVVLDAVDVAFTEASVGAGISTILMLATLGIVGPAERERPVLAPGPLLLVVATGLALAWGLADFPAFGDPQAPAFQHVAPDYLARSLPETGIPNVVTSVLASYRGYDTLGETTVIFTAGIGVLALLGRSRRRRRPSRS